MVRSGLRVFEGKENGKKGLHFKMQRGSKATDHDGKTLLKSKQIEESKAKVKQGLLASWEILQEMEEEMTEMEEWLRSIEGVLGEAVAEFLEGVRW